MKVVFNSKDLPTRRLVVNTSIATYPTGPISVGDQIDMVRRDMAMAFADKIIYDDKYIKYESSSGYMHIKGSAYVLTEEELHDLFMQKFQEGVQHAQGFMSRDPLNIV